jgi:glycosyltransferase involved in cell wall biosynthesis
MRTLPHARVLADALAHHHPGARLQALAVGGSPATWSRLPFDVITMADLAGGDGATPQTHLPEDLEMLLRPALIEHIRSNAGRDDVCFLSADHDVLSPLETAVDAGAGVALARRLNGSLPADTFSPDPDDLAEQGLYSPDFLIVGTSARAQEFLNWYGRRLSALKAALATRAPVAVRAHARLRARQLLTLAPSLFGIRVVDDPGVEVSAWNLHSRPLVRRQERILAARHPLRTIQFAGFDPLRPYWLSDWADRVRVVDDPVLSGLCADYADRLLLHGWQWFDRRADVGRRLPNGLVFDARLYELFTEAMNAGVDLSDPFDPPGCDAFMEWMLGAAPAGAAAGINRYLYRVYLDRPDLAKAYPYLDGVDGSRYASWSWLVGRSEMSIPDEFLPARPADVAGVAPPEAVSVNVTGFFRGTLGLGEAARLYVKALEAGSVPVTTTTVEVDRPVQEAHQRLGKDYGKLAFADIEAAQECRFNLICVNADELARFVANSGTDFFAGRRSIGVWAWETDVIPARWDAAYRHLDEIWVYSRYVAENLGRASPIPVVCVPPPVVAPDGAGAVSGIELPDGFRFMFMFDFFSTQKRKNPAGVIEAFRRAFSPGDGPQLLIKTIHAEARPRAYDELRHAAAGRPDVHIVDRALSTPAKNALMAECDCYVSLHRSEGYGLPLAECMALGKPVIGTGYSGNLDFMSPANSYLVDHTMTAVGGDVEIYPPEGRWAEPALDHAAALMREVYENPHEARARGERARVDIAATLSPEVVGRIAADRLRRLVSFAGT